MRSFVQAFYFNTSKQSDSVTTYIFSDVIDSCIDRQRFGVVADNVVRLVKLVGISKYIQRY
jgi:hypothetical protein